jgi:hypothetical protein
MEVGGGEKGGREERERRKREGQNEKQVRRAEWGIEKTRRREGEERDKMEGKRGREGRERDKMKQKSEEGSGG